MELLLPPVEDNIYRCFSYHISFFTHQNYRFNLQLNTIHLKPNYPHSIHCCYSPLQDVVFGRIRQFQTEDGISFHIRQFQTEDQL